MVSQQELDNWALNAGFFYLNIEEKDTKYRQKFCSKCTDKMKNKRKCQIGSEGRTFCKHLVRSRENDKELRKQNKQMMMSPYVKELIN